MTKLIALTSIGLAVVCGCASVTSQSSWTSISDLPTPFDGRTDVSVREQAANPSLSIDATPYIGHWLRLRADVEDSGALGLAISAYSGNVRQSRIPLTECDHDRGRARCWTARYIFPGTTRIGLAVYPDDRYGSATQVTLEVGDVTLSTSRRRDEFAAMVETLRTNYYRASEVDWDLVAARVAPMAFAPADIDPRPAAFFAIRDALPGNEHTGAFRTVRADTPQAEHPVLPTCNAVSHSIRMLTLPGTVALATSQYDEYIELAQGCLREGRQAASWIINLRTNDGGNLWVMLTAIAPLLHAGVQMGYLNAAGKFLPLEVTAAGVVIDGHVVFAHSLTDQIGRDSEKAALVWISPACGSSCEAMAIALADRPRTTLIGKATAGLTTGNESIDIGHVLTGFYTAGWMAHGDGRKVMGKIVPAIDYSGDNAIAVSQHAP